MNKSRAILIAFMVALFFVVLTAKLFNIQLSEHTYYSQKAFRQQFDTLVVKAERGLILDRSGEVLVYTNDEVSLFADTRMLNSVERDTVASLFLRVFHKNKEHFLQLMNKRNGNVCLVKKTDREKALEIERRAIDGLFSEANFSRQYPYSGLAAHVLGYANRNMVGVAGIESEYNEYLTGEDGYRRIERDVQGRPVSLDSDNSKEPRSGQNVYLTINKTYQQILEEELFAGVQRMDAESGVGIIMDPNSGEILAMANLPTYDPQNYNVFNDLERKNISITDIYEPGSTMKSVSMAMLLNEKLVQANEVINTENGVYKIHGINIRDDHKYDRLNVREILEHSSNIGLTKIIERLDERKFYKYLRDFGFGMPTYVDLPGEVSGILRTPDKYSGVSKSFMSFGYEIAVTPLQMVTAYSALINGGKLYKPYVVKKITNEYDNTVNEVKPLVIRRVIDQEASNTIKKFMVGVVEQGTGQPAAIASVKTGGKTGTSKRLTGGAYSKGDYNASFCGFLPVDAPKLVCLIVIHSPKNGKYGSTVAAPVFQRTMERIVESNLEILPDNVIEEEGEFRIFERITTASNGSYREYANPEVRQKVDPKKIAKEVASRSTMPNLTDNSVREAVAIISELGLKSKVQGRGRVFYQSIPAGTKIQKGKTCEIKCRVNRKSRAN